jgi:hypothetical protein
MPSHCTKQVAIETSFYDKNNIKLTVRRYPTDNYWHARIRPRRRQEQTCVLDVRLVMHREHDCKTSKGNSLRYEREDESVLCAVRGNGNNHGERERACPRRDGEELCADGRVTEALDDAGSKVS